MNSGRSRRTPSSVVKGRRFRSSAAVNRSDLAVPVWRNFATVNGGWGPGSGDGAFAPAHAAHTRIAAIANAVLVVIPTLQLMLATTLRVACSGLVAGASGKRSF